MAEYEGTILFVSHDRDFIEEVCTHVYAMIPEGRGQLFEGNLADYKRLAPLGNFPDVLDVSVEQSPAEKKDGEVKHSQASRAASKDEKRERQKKERRIGEIEGLLKEKEQSLARLEEEMSTESSYQILAGLAESAQKTRDLVTALEEEWLGLQD